MFTIILDILQAISVIIASFVAVYGISSWRREIKWKRKYELAEDVLSRFYEISERFDEIRSPFGFVGEGNTRKKSDYEPKEVSELLDRAYTVIERYEKNKASFIKLRSLKYRFMVLYGKEGGEPFDKIARLTNKLFRASHSLGYRYWRDQGRRKFIEDQFQNHLQQMQEAEAIIWADYDEKDEFKESVNKVILEIEAICKGIIEKNRNLIS